MNAGYDTSTSRDHEADRRFLRWLRGASLPELRAMTATQDRTSCPNWERVAVAREIERRGGR